MIKLLQLKQVLRNKRFLFFTIVIPAFWLLGLDLLLFSVQHNNLPYFGSAVSYKYVILATCCLTEIAGNAIITFSKRINTSKNYYLLQFKITHYSVWNWLFNTLLTQIILDLLITIVLVVLGMLLHMVSLNGTLLMLMLLVNILGIYLSLIGFVLGILCDGKTLDVSGFPILLLVALLIIPFSRFDTGTFENMIVKVQKIFPGYYTYNIISQLSNAVAVKPGDIILFLITMLITVLPFCIIMALKLSNNRKMVVKES